MRKWKILSFLSLKGVKNPLFLHICSKKFAFRKLLSKMLEMESIIITQTTDQEPQQKAICPS